LPLPGISDSPSFSIFLETVSSLSHLHLYFHKSAIVSVSHLSCSPPLVPVTLICSASLCPQSMAVSDTLSLIALSCSFYISVYGHLWESYLFTLSL
jgi:hypothetical protein